MAVTQFQKPRPACRICGSRSHVTAVANPNSPRLGCCASCGEFTAVFAEAIRLCGEARAQQFLARAIQINHGQMSLAEADASQA